MRRLGQLAALALAAGLVVLSGTAGAATTSAWGTFAPGAGIATSMQLAGTGYPAATISTTSGPGSGVGLQSGATTYLRTTTPPGAFWGSSQNKPYLNLAPASGGTPSVTTYTFASPAPIGWGFVLGDVDADQVQVSATRADGTPASAADLGFVGVFNYAGGTDLPTWTAATATLGGSGSNTDGAAGWFRPIVPLKTLTFRFSTITGFPTFQTWFASRTQDVTGTVTAAAGCDVTTAALNLVDGAGTVLATTSPAADGTYSFAKVAATDAYAVALAGAPAGCTVSGPGTRSVDLRTTDAVADFALAATASVPAAGRATGQVTDRAGEPVEGARVVVSGPDGRIGSDETGPGGRFTVPDLPAGPLEATLRPPAGFDVVGTATRPVVVPAGGGPVALDFVVRRTAEPVATAAPAVAVLPEVGGPPYELLGLGSALLVVGLSVLAQASGGATVPSARRRTRGAGRRGRSAGRTPRSCAPAGPAARGRRRSAS